MDFLEARKVPKVNIVLGGESYEISRQGLSGHYALESTSAKIRKSMDKGLYATVDHIFTWLSYATGFGEDWFENQDPIELANAFSTLVELNAPKDTLPWMTIGKEHKPTTTDYPNRSLASIVDLIASEYHWSEEEIINLPPEVAWCYVQEILLSRHEQAKWEYSLSEVSYDKHGQLKEFPKLPWDMKTQPKDTAPIPDFLKPTGVVIDLSKEQ